MARFEETSVEVIRPNGWLRFLYGFPALSLAAIVMGIAFAAPSAGGNSEFGAFLSTMFMLTLISGVGCAVAIRRNAAPRREMAPITADLTGVRSGSELLVARERIKDAYLVAQPDGRCRVRLVGKRLVPLLDVMVATRERGNELLRALELDVLHRVLESPAYVMLNGRSTPTRMLVGADGVVVRHAAVGFIPYSDIEDVKIGPTGGVLRRRSGGELNYIGFGVTPGALTERIKAGIEAHRRAEPAADAAALVARSGRPVAEWVTALRALSQPSGGDYRTAALPDDTLWTLAEDHGADPTARAGAAVVLRERLGDQGRVRLEATAAATVEPKVRVALEAAAKGDEKELTEALERCDEEQLRMRA